MPPKFGQLAPPKPPPEETAAAPPPPAAHQQSENRSQTAAAVIDSEEASKRTTSSAQPTAIATAVTTTNPAGAFSFSSSATAATATSSSSLPSAPPAPASFIRRKETILAQLALPDDEYTDLSPKGTVDAGIRDLIDEINALDGLVTTSSCAGRVSVFLEGRRGGRGPLPPPAGGNDLGGGGLGPGPPGPPEAAQGDFSPVAEEQPQLPGHPQAVLVDEEDGGEDAAGGVGRATTTTTKTVAGVGGKGGGGKWLFVSHDPVQMEGKLDSEPNIVGALLGMEEPIFDGREGSQAEGMGDGGTRLIHFKFEPMILHILTASPYHAQVILRCALQAGFRESGAINLVPPVVTSSASSASPLSTSTATPIVAVRSMGLGLESLIGRETNGIKHCTVSGEYLKALIRIANERFVDNARRIERFRTYLREAVSFSSTSGGITKKKEGDGGGGIWEDAETRKERKRAEGLKRAEEVRKMREELEREQRERDRDREQ